MAHVVLSRHPGVSFDNPANPLEMQYLMCTIANIEHPKTGCHRQLGLNISLCVLDIALCPISHPMRANQVKSTAHASDMQCAAAALTTKNLPET
jgi:hypothetical protein